MKKVMVRAWEIAREAVKKFGGKVKEFFQQALIMAWKESKSSKVPALAELQGSEKQVAWAKDIRAKMLTDLKMQMQVIKTTSDLETVKLAKMLKVELSKEVPAYSSHFGFKESVSWVREEVKEAIRNVAINIRKEASAKTFINNRLYSIGNLMMMFK